MRAKPLKGTREERNNSVHPTGSGNNADTSSKQASDR